eukprot:1588524-Amphidinium_carterae.6
MGSEKALAARMTIAAECSGVYLMTITAECSGEYLAVTHVMKEEVFEDALKVLRDIFASKATATLRLRHNSVMKFVNWRRSISEDLANNTLPVDEQTLYDYVCFS